MGDGRTSFWPMQGAFGHVMIGANPRDGRARHAVSPIGVVRRDEIRAPKAEILHGIDLFKDRRRHRTAFPDLSARLRRVRTRPASRRTKLKHHALVERRFAATASGQWRHIVD